MQRRPAMPRQPPMTDGVKRVPPIGKVQLRTRTAADAAAPGAHLAQLGEKLRATQH